MNGGTRKGCIRRWGGSAAWIGTAVFGFRNSDARLAKLFQTACCLLYQAAHVINRF